MSVIFFNFPSFSDLERKFLSFCREFFEAVDKPASCISNGTFRGNVLFCKLFSIILGQGTKKLRAFVEKVSTGLSQLHSTCPLQIIRGRRNFCKSFIFSYRFRTLRESFWPSCREIFEVVDKTASCMSIGTFRGNILFCKNSIFFHHSRTRGKKTSAFCRKVSVGFAKTASYMSLGIIGGRLIFCRKFNFSYRFRSLS